MLKNQLFLEELQESTYAYYDREPLEFTESTLKEMFSNAISPDTFFDSEKIKTNSKSYSEWKQSADSFSSTNFNHFKEILSKRSSKYENPISHAILSNIHNRICQSLEHYKPSYFDKSQLETIENLKRNPPLFGTLPTGQVNARVINNPTTKDFLVLFDDQLINYAGLMSKAIAYAMKPVFTHGMMALSSNLDDVIDRIKSDPKVGERFSIPMTLYLCEGIMGVSPYLVEHPYSAMRKKLVDGLELFIMGHEYAHIILGHINEENLVSTMLSDSSISEYNTNWGKEFAADIVGAELMSIACQLQGHHFYDSFLGYDFFFICSSLVQRSTSVLLTGKDKLWDYPGKADQYTHPPPLLRLSNLHKFIKAKFDEKKADLILKISSDTIKIMEALWQLCLLPFLLELHKQKKEPAKIWKEQYKKYNE